MEICGDQNFDAVSITEDILVFGEVYVHMNCIKSCITINNLT